MVPRDSLKRRPAVLMLAPEALEGQLGISRFLRPETSLDVQRQSEAAVTRTEEEALK